MQTPATDQPKAWLHVEAGTAAQPALVRWGVFYPAGSDRGGRNGTIYQSYALRTAGGLVLVDPARPTAALEADLRAILQGMGGRPLASVLTNDMHERDAYLGRQEYGVPVWAPAAGQGEYVGQPDRLYGEGDRLPGGLRAVKIEGPFPGDTCLLAEAADGTRALFTGDAIMGPRDPEDPRPAPAQPGPTPGLRLHGVGSHRRGAQDMATFKASLRRLLDEPFDLLCPAHGLPIHDAPKAALERLLQQG
jgi:glyoxylase-like metal-dependent hydrolase (beta-lactamase superfamily II)